jgi:ribulose kinase
MNNTIILTTPDQLQRYIGQAVEAIIPKLADFRRRNEAKQTDNLTLTEAIDYLAELGAPTTKSAIYNLTFRGMIPHRKIGRRTIFSRRELAEWVESRTHRPEDAKAEAVRRIAQSATRKLAKYE